MTRLSKSFFTGALLAAIVFGQAVASTAFAAADPNIVSASRAAAIRECNIKASAYILTTWGNWQLYVYRTCMAAHHEVE